MAAQWSINEQFVTQVFALFPAECLLLQLYIVVVCCPSVLWLRRAPTDNRQLTGWWLRKATHGGVVMATEACQTDCVKIGQVWTHDQYPPHSTPIWHFRHRIFAVKICSCWMFVQQAQLNTLGFLSALTRIYQSISGCPNNTEMIISSLLFIPTASMSDPLVIKLRINRSFF